ncbi:MAG: penicillin-binding protein 2 [Gammaproteobacteria bacterium]
MLLINTRPATLAMQDLVAEQLVFRARVIAAVAFVALAFLILILRMAHLQVTEYDHFRTLSENNRVKILPLEPTRGLIFDRNGVVLAQNVPTYSLDVVPEAVEDITVLLEQLREMVVITEGDERRFRQALNEQGRFDNVPLRLRLTEEEVARFAVNRHRFPGVDIRARLSREYPLGSLMAHVVGYMNRITEDDLDRIDETNYRASTHIGRTGVERAYEEVLHGEVGYQHVETNAHDRVLRVLEREEASPGADLHLSIDAGLQAVAEAALGVENGTVVAIDPLTGGVLAMVSTPTFDPNQFVTGIDLASFKALNTSPERPLFNRVLYGKYPPGSTLKPFIALGGLEFDAPTTRRRVFCPGYFTLKGSEHRYRDWKRTGHGQVDMARSIIESCDIYYYELALELGIDGMHHFLALFGFGSPTGLDLATESAGLLPSRRWKKARHKQAWYPGETLITGIGQGFTLTTPLQLASATATLATRGLRLQPQLVERIVDSVNVTEQVNAPRIVGQIELTETKHWGEIIDAMVDSVHSKAGTAFRISRGMNYKMAGKTGTAQVFGIPQGEEYDAEKLEKKLRDHALFVAFAPLERPRIAVAVVVENGGSGGSTAAPIARKVVDHFLGEPDSNAQNATANLTQDLTN